MSRRAEPGPGQESVWDYPRPPRVELSSKRVRVVFDGITIADSTRSHRVLETSHPPVYYIPPADIDMKLLKATSHATFCEWKGYARYFALVAGRTVDRAAWCYFNPSPQFTAIRDCVAFYPSKVDACFINEEQVRAQDGDFYGGWITSEIVGPFKGGIGTRGW